jgi:hypothetical protein
MPIFGQEDFEFCQKKGPLTDKAYLDALAKCRKLSRDEGIDAVAAKYKLDAIVAPTSGPAWLIDYVNCDADVGGCSSAAAVAGYPHITVPAGLRARPARRGLFLRSRLERAGSVEGRVRLRAVDQGSPRSALPAHVAADRVGTVKKWCA